MTISRTTPTDIKPNLILVSAEARCISQSIRVGYDAVATTRLRFSKISATPEISGVRVNSAEVETVEGVEIPADGEETLAVNWFFNGHNNKLTFDYSYLTLDDGLVGMAFVDPKAVSWNDDIEDGFWSEGTLRRIKR